VPATPRSQRRMSTLSVVTSTVEVQRVRRMPIFPSKDNGSMVQRTAILFEDLSGEYCRAGLYIALLVIFTILFSVGLFMVESQASAREFTAACATCKPLEGDALSSPSAVANRSAAAGECALCEPAARPIFYTLETICIVIFTIEYLLRLLTVHSIPCEAEAPDINGIVRDPYSGSQRTWIFFKAKMCVVDLVAIVPYYIEIIAAGDAGGQMAVLRVLRLARILRIFKLAKYSDTLQLFGKVMESSIFALYILMAVCTMGMVVFGSLIYFAEGGTWDPETGEYMRLAFGGDSMEASPFQSIPDSFWWVVVTMTTVGYGDVYPTTPVGKLIGVFCMFSGILTLALPITVIGGNFSAEFDKMEALKASKEAKRLQLQRQDALINDIFDRRCDPSRCAFKTWQLKAGVGMVEPEVTLESVQAEVRALRSEVVGVTKAEVGALRAEMAAIAKALQTLVAAQAEQEQPPVLAGQVNAVLISAAAPAPAGLAPAPA
jgi:hypothetical protein